MIRDPSGSFSPPASNVVDRLHYWAEHKTSATAFTYLLDGEDDEVHWDYGELDRHARAVAAQLEAMNLAGERALLLFPPGLDFIAAFFGCLYAGVIAVPAYPPRPSGRMRGLDRCRAIARDAGVSIVLATEHFVGLLEEISRQAPEL